MFEKMRRSGFAARIVGRADLVPDHLGDRGDPMVRQHDNLKPVGQAEALRPELLRPSGPDAKCGNDQQTSDAGKPLSRGAGEGV